MPEFNHIPSFYSKCTRVQKNHAHQLLSFSHENFRLHDLQFTIVRIGSEILETEAEEIVRKLRALVVLA